MASRPEERAHGGDVEAQAPSEQTPLLARADEDTEATDRSRPQNERSASSELFSNLTSGGKSARRRWPSLLALLLLCVVVVLIMVFAFLAPSVVEQYAQQAVTFEPTSLSIAGFTPRGVRARVQGDFTMDGSKVQPKSVRDLGRFGTWIAHKAESGESKVEVSLPEYDILLGTATVPPIVVDLRDGEVTHVEFYTDLERGDLNGVRTIASKWIDGTLGDLRVLGKADVPIKSGIFSFGTQRVVHELLFANKDIPTMPAYKIKKLNIHEVDYESGTGMAADVSLQVENPYPVDFTVPPMSFDVLVNGCQSTSQIMVANAVTKPLEIRPKTDVELNVTGIVRKIPDVLTQECPGSRDTPLDMLIGNYMRGKDTTLYVKGSDRATPDTPDWVRDLLSSVTVPVDVPGKSFGHLIKNFSMKDTHFSLPSIWAEPGTPDADPKISATVQALIALPEEMNFNLTADAVRANATVYYMDKQLGIIDIREWQPANTTRLPADEDGPSMTVESKIKDQPIHITDDDLFTDLLTELLVGSHSVIATLKANVSVGVDTALGHFAVKGIPAEGQVPLKPFSPGHGSHNSTPADMVTSLNPRIYDLSIVSSTPTTLTISALVNITNPTEYTADIPYLSLHILTNGSILANASVQDIKVGHGNLTALKAVATWNPLGLGGRNALQAGVSFMSQFISGCNTSLTVKPHEHSIPSLPGLSKALSKFNVTVPTPKLPDTSQPPEDDKDNGPKFITEAKFHLFSSTADFVLRSPLRHDTLTITYINATAFYKDARVGQIVYNEPFDVEPIDEFGDGSLTPRLPVDWETGGIGWDAVRRALGGRLQIAAEAIVDIAIGRWSLRGVWFRGHGLGVGVRP
ncbi:hypothetical protein AMS68_002599 [Peltaster fructicola]|uniref:Late embryogenesis abundant protein LEA-2 subgroup domain-containing protein n=1 Tax=Peltaster fructicola TaxID=286661 RepID=A0A6H0XQN4_9PEZI|nr:hypothetical protein AMS68_002599 [Peltaster fructicola]